jgi:hypothetical protein
MLSVQGSSKAALLGEATVNLAEYADALKPSAVTLPLKGSPGALLHVSITISALSSPPPSLASLKGSCRFLVTCDGDVLAVYLILMSRWCFASCDR